MSFVNQKHTALPDENHIGRYVRQTKWGATLTLLWT